MNPALLMDASWIETEEYGFSLEKGKFDVCMV